ncbi:MULTISPECIES: glucoamylase family protein [unclassified Luteimonas]
MPPRRPWLLLPLVAVLLFAGCGREAPDSEVAPPRPGPIEEVVVTAPPPTDAAMPAKMPLPQLFRDIEKRTFQFFWDTTDERNGMTPDRFPSRPFASVAAIGFALTAYPVGIENGWIGRRQAVDRTLLTLEFLLESPQGPEATGTIGHRGFFYHFLDMRTGHRYEPWVELSSVDTGLMMLGVLFAQSYYDGDDPREQRIRELADELYGRIEWPWLQQRPPLISMGWYPERGFIEHDWTGYDEAMLVYILALGSPTHPVEPEAWTAWTQTYDDSWGIFQGQEYLSFAPHFGHQYSHAWIDFRGIRDAYMRGRGIDYFENSRRATYAQRSYAIENPMGWKGYGADIWGLTASDGPQRTDQEFNGELREFRHYSARGAGIAVAFDDGTIAPTAAIGSLPYAPEIVIPATQALVDQYGEYLYSSYGFLDAFNPSFDFDIPLKTGRLVPGRGWVASDYIGIDQGPILIGIANYRNDFVWNVMKRNPHIRRGLERAGFTGGWLAELQARDAAGAAERAADEAEPAGGAGDPDGPAEASPSPATAPAPPPRAG